MRGFSLVEMIVVIAVIGVSASLAGMGLSESVADSKARADEQTIFTTIREQRAFAREKMHGLKLTTLPANPHVLIFQAANNDCSVVSPDRAVFHFKYGGLNIDQTDPESHRALCWDIEGRPVPPGARDDEGGIIIPTPIEGVTDGLAEPTFGLAQIVSTAGGGRLLPLRLDQHSVGLEKPHQDSDGRAFVGRAEAPPSDVRLHRRPKISPEVREAIRVDVYGSIELTTAEVLNATQEN